jgi:hypothetical protein
MTEADDIGLSEAPYGSALYVQALRLREAILRKPLGLTLSAEELADDAHRRHFCAIMNGSVIGSVSFKRLGAILCSSSRWSWPTAGRAKASARGCWLTPRLGRGVTAMA